MLHNESTQKAEQTTQKIKIIIFNVNMGASEAAIAEKVKKKMQAAHPQAEISIESRFYVGELLWTSIQKEKNTFNRNKKCKPADKEEYKEIKNKFLEDPKNSFADIYNTLSRFSARKRQSLTYRYQPFKDADTILLKTYGFVGDEELPYQKLSQITANNSNSTDNVIEVKILLAQTTDCGKYSAANFNNNKNTNLNSKQQETENSYFNDFRFAVEVISPDIVLCENVATIKHGGAEILKKIQTVLEGIGLRVQQQEIDHSMETASKRKRNYIIGSHSDFTLQDFFPKNKKRLPHKYLYHVNLPIEPKYARLKLLEEETKAIEVLQKKSISQEKHTFTIVNVKELLHALRVYHCFNFMIKDVKQHVILLPEKAAVAFPTKKGNKRKNKGMRAGMTVDFISSTGELKFSFGKNLRLLHLRVLHSKAPLCTLTSEQDYYFWDLNGYSPSIGELAMMQGMSKAYTEKLVNYDNDIRHTAAIQTLSHNLSPKVITPILSQLIELRVFNDKLRLSTNNDEPTQTYDAISELSKGLNLADYELEAHPLDVSGHYIYLAKIKGGDYLDKGIILSDLSLDELHKLGYIRDGKLLLTNFDRQNNLPSIETTKSSKLEIDSDTESEDSEIEDEARIDSIAEVEDEEEVEVLAAGAVPMLMNGDTNCNKVSSKTILGKRNIDEVSTLTDFLDSELSLFQARKLRVNLENNNATVQHKKAR